MAITVGASVRQQDLAVAGERPEPRAAAGAIIEAGRGRIEQQVHRRGCRARRWAGRGTGRAAAARYGRRGPASAGRISPAGPRATMWKVPSLEALARARQPQLGRIELQVGEMDDAVVAALEVGGQRRQAAGQARGRSCCRAAAPRPWRCRRRALPLLFGPGTTLRSVITSTMPRPGDQVALHRARQERRRSGR